MFSSSLVNATSTGFVQLLSPTVRALIQLPLAQIPPRTSSEGYRAANWCVSVSPAIEVMPNTPSCQG